MSATSGPQTQTPLYAEKQSIFIIKLHLVTIAEVKDSDRCRHGYLFLRCILCLSSWRQQSLLLFRSQLKITERLSGWMFTCWCTHSNRLTSLTHDIQLHPKASLSFKLYLNPIYSHFTKYHNCKDIKLLYWFIISKGG